MKRFTSHFPLLIVALLALFSLAYLWFLNRVNRHYGAK